MTSSTKRHSQHPPLPAGPPTAASTAILDVGEQLAQTKGTRL